jgi:hypothetical protein
MWSAWRNSCSNLRWPLGLKNGPFVRYYFNNKIWYFQAGFRPDAGWPVLSAGTTPQEGFDYGN